MPSPKVASDICRRRRHTPFQRGLSQSEREDNLSGAFHLKPGAAKKIRGKHIALVDDVYTTGSTLRALSAVFTDSEVREISIWALCSTASAHKN